MDEHLFTAEQVAERLGVSDGDYGTTPRGAIHGFALSNAGKERLKTKANRAPIPVPEPVGPVIEAWQRICKDSCPEVLGFPTFGRGKRLGKAVPRNGNSFLKWRRSGA